MPRLITYVAGFVFFAIVTMIMRSSSGWFAISSGIAIGFLLPLVDTFITHFRDLKVVWYSIRTWRTRVRISASYLYRIRVENEYLLVKGKRFDHFQPVGGVYKAHPSSSGFRNAINVLDDDLLLPDAVSENDLRVRVPGKHLVQFMRWFEAERGRETDGAREFYEELVATGILSSDTFRVVKYDRLERRYHPMRFSAWANSQEILIADILELLPTPAQLEELKRLRSRPNAEILWASERQIRRRGATEGGASQTIRIADTAIWTIDASS